jgi:hypothetical protein
MMKNSKSISPILFCIIALLFSSEISAQETQKSKGYYYFEPAISYGRFVPTVPEDHFLWQKSIYNVILSFGKQTTGEKAWERAFNCPDYGFAIKYGYMDYEAFNSRFAIYAYINGRIYENEFLGFTYKLGGGLSCWNKIYDETTNPDNIFISTHLNCHLNIDLGAFFKISPKTDIVGNVVVSHSSNGALKLPNRGSNALTGQLGLRYHLQDRPLLQKNIDTVLQFHPKNSFYVTEAPGILESHAGDVTKFHFANTMQLGYARQFNRKFRYGAGFDLMYSTELLMKLPEEQRQDYYRAFNSAVYGSFDVLYDKVMIHIAFAKYIYRSFDFFIPVYERFGVKYMFGKDNNHAVGIMMKLHFASIDYIEWGYTYQFANWYDK